MTTTTDEVDGAELTEFEAIEVQQVKGVGKGANGFPHLLMKGVAEPAVKGARDCKGCGKTYDADSKAGNCENCGDKLPDAPAAAKSAPADAGATPGSTAKTPPGWLDELTKAMSGGKVDEAPDIALGQQVMKLLGQAISNEADELGAGNYGEAHDVGMLKRAAEIVSCWISREQAVAAGQDPDANCGCCNYCSGIGCGCCDSCGMGSVMCAAADPADPEGDYAYLDVAKDTRTFTAAERKNHAANGEALPDGSYPIPDKDALRRAAILARSGHGDVKAAKKLIAKRAKALGVPNPLDDDADDTSDTSKAAVAGSGATVQDDQQGTGGQIAKAVDDAVTKATAPLEKLRSELESVLAKVKATPQPGGPVLSANVRAIHGTDDGNDWAAKSAYYREMAETVTDRVSADGYRKLAREADEKAKAPAS